MLILFLQCFSTFPILTPSLFAGEDRQDAEVKLCFLLDTSLQFASHTGLTCETRAGRHPPQPWGCLFFWAVWVNSGHLSVSCVRGSGSKQGERHFLMLGESPFPSGAELQRHLPLGSLQDDASAHPDLGEGSADRGGQRRACLPPAVALEVVILWSLCLRHVSQLRSPYLQLIF